MRNLYSLDWKGKTALVRSDLNVPLTSSGDISDDTRIRASLPTINHILENGGGVIVASHMGRPKEGIPDPALSLRPIAKKIGQLLEMSVNLVPLGSIVPPGTVSLLENVRFNVGEKSNSPELCEQYARNIDVFVMDAFATAHRIEASTVGVSQSVQTSCSGLLLEAELDTLQKMLHAPEHPMIAIIGGGKISTKLKTISKISRISDITIVGGGIANTFLAAKGYDIGCSLCEHNMVEVAREIINEVGEKLKLPCDAVCSTKCLPDAKVQTRPINEIKDDEMILDIGEVSIQQFSDHISKAKTILWNGPVGAFETAPFEQGTKRIGEVIASSSAFSIAGGGDTVAAVTQFNLSKKISYISTGGGAFLAFIENGTLPAVEALKSAS